MLLHVIEAAVGVDFAANTDARPQPARGALDKVQNVAGLLLLLNVDDPYTGTVGNPKDLAGVEILSAAGGIES